MGKAMNAVEFLKKIKEDLLSSPFAAEASHIVEAIDRWMDDSKEN
jgi:hypothetical protein